MDDMVKELIAFDKKARETVQEAEQKRDGIKTAIAGEKEQLRKDYFERAQSRIEKMKQNADDEAMDQAAQIDGGFHSAAAELEKKFTDNRSVMAREIADRCIRTELAR